MPPRKERRAEESPESQILPHEDLNARQGKITGENFPDVVLEICDNCHWCATCMNGKRMQVTCPACGRRTSRIPMTMDETCILEKDEKRGITLRFVRTLPLR
ncbi:hypothetical protein [Nitrososphaera viennensis]|uniref:Uncharacterized protein n=1 Tax=Nitrososphaera viennensis TaxID=1034015 RepID=A0A977IEZ6_9ARCH|nr:hypothetical protein [Nitrososphaera viennensis]UVS69555.1 hypothetical protein NWT39_01925 [Nitrososphaera viennensis]